MIENNDVLSLRAEMIKNWKNWIWKVIDVIKKYLPDAEIHIIGSVAEDKYTAASDLDLLIISRNIPDKLSEIANLKTMIENDANLPIYHPIEFHFTKPEVGRLYLQRCRKFIKLC